MTNTTLLPAGERVRLDGNLGWCTIIGHTVGARASEPTEVAHVWYVVELDDGFWGEGRENYVSLLVVHADAVHEIAFDNHARMA
jgi:hypothetical protein